MNIDSSDDEIHKVDSLGRVRKKRKRYIRKLQKVHHCDTHGNVGNVTVSSHTKTTNSSNVSSSSTSSQILDAECRGNITRQEHQFQNECPNEYENDDTSDVTENVPCLSPPCEELPYITIPPTPTITIENRTEFIQQLHSAREQSIYNDTDNDSDAPVDVDETHDLFDEFLNYEPDADIDQENTKTGTNSSDKIYTGHTMSVNTSLVIILLYSIAHSITGTQLNDLLSIISLHCLTAHPALSSVKRFKSYFRDISTPLIKHYYCSSCFQRVTANDKCCTNDKCNKCFRKDGARSYFIEVPIENQLQSMFDREQFRNALKHRFNRPVDSVIHDVYDGSIYKNLSRQNGPLSKRYPYNLSFTFNMDGVSVFKSSKFSLWPVFLMINELPYKDRIKKENVIMCGLWFGPNKPVINTFSLPLYEQLSKLENDGILIRIGEKLETVFCYLLYGTCDLPARACALNMILYNGSYSCHMCLQSGRTTKTGKGHCHVFPFNQQDPTGPLRTNEDCKRQGRVALETKKTVYGIKGPSFMTGFKYFDMSTGMGIDYMHGVLLGVTKMLTKLLFQAKYSGNLFSLSNSVDLVDKRLLQIKPPYYISRRPRSISEHIKFWKASELRSWLLYYSLPILSDLMSSEYFYHYACFVQSVWLLSSTSITEQDLERCKVCLKYFVFMFESLYGEQFCSLNLHGLLHLPDCVSQIGPIWSFSCFSFEDLNGDIVKLFHGTQFIELQTTTALSIVRSLPKMIESILRTEDEKIINIVNGFKQSKRYTVVSQLDHDIYSVSKSKPMTILDENVYAALCISLGHHILRNDIEIYDRLVLRGVLYQTTNYSRVTSRNSCTIQYTTSPLSVKYGAIKWFVKHDTTVYAVVGKFNLIEPVISDKKPNYLPLSCSHIIPCNVTEDIDVVNCHSIRKLCIILTFDDFTFITIPSNTIEID